jgi:UDP-N-acetylglucosamine enolpyruvyl transferase
VVAPLTICATSATPQLVSLMRLPFLSWAFAVALGGIQIALVGGVAIGGALDQQLALHAVIRVPQVVGAP